MPALPKNAQAFPAVSGGAGPAPSAPSLSVAGRVDGGAYTVSAGGRSVTITAQQGAALQTTATRASDGATVSVTDSTTATPDWPAPSGGTEGESVQVRVTATKDNLTSAVSWTERVAGSASSRVTIADLDFKDLATASDLATGAHTLSFQSSGTTVDVNWGRFSGGNATITPTNTVGLVINGGTDTSSGNTISFDMDPLFASYTVQNVRAKRYAFHVVISGLAYPSAGNSLIFVGLNRGNVTTHNSGNARMFWAEDAGDGSNEEIRSRKNTSSSALLRTQAIKTSRVITLILTDGQIIEAMDTAGTSPPEPDPGASSNIVLGGDSLGLGSDAPTYQANGVRVFVCSGDTANLTIERLQVETF